MSGRVKGVIGLALSAFLLMAAFAAPGSARAEPRIVAVGDLHGDYDAYFAIVRSAGLVDERGHWTGGSTVFVQTGDVADRGPDSLKIIRHLIRLQREAPRVGGRVVTLVGNHEAMNVIGDLRYVHPGEYAAFADRNSERRRDQAWETNRAVIEGAYRARDRNLGSEAIRAAWIKDTPLGKVEHRAAWRPGGELGRWAVASPAAALIGDTLFVHGGISADYARMPLDEINRRAAAALAARNQADDAIINDPLGPLWYRGLVIREAEGQGGAGDGPGGAARPSIEAELEAVLRAYGARRIVVGHTPNPRGVSIRHEGRLVRIDTGISAAYKGKLTYIEIRNGRVVPYALRARPGTEAAPAAGAGGR